MMNYVDSSNYHANHFSSYYNQNDYTENLTELIVNEAASLYEKMVKDFTNQIITNAAAISSSAKLLPSMRYSDEQTDHTQALAYRHITDHPFTSIV
jgi:hypothetical protein